MRPVQFFKNNADHRRRRSACAPRRRHCRSGGAIFVSKNYGFFLQKFWIIYDDRRGEKKGKASLQPATRPLDFARRYCI